MADDKTSTADKKSRAETVSQDLPPKHQDSPRDTIESIAVAFLLAFLFRSFVAEAFVIPTGSMAPTLYGRNKDAVCPECGVKYTFGTSTEINNDSDDGHLVARAEYATCPNCRHLNNIRDLSVFNGDRIIVNKFPYQVADPKRWDVVVFKFPNEPSKNYIKRLVGLPGETVQIEQGDLYARKSEAEEFAILRKENPEKQRHTQILVYDDRHPARELLKAGWPERWASVAPKESADAIAGWSDSPDGWKAESLSRTYSLSASAELNWLRYRHFVATKDDWDQVERKQGFRNPPRPQLITDFCNYNAVDGRVFRGTGSFHESLHQYWIGDLTLDATIKVESASTGPAELVLELVRGVGKFRCKFDLKSGQASLWRNEFLNGDAVETPMGTADTAVKGAGTFRISFANVDQRLCLWVNDRLVTFGKEPGVPYPRPSLRSPQVADLSPVGIAASGAAVTVSDLVLRRDIYYRADHDYQRSDLETGSLSTFDIQELNAALYDPLKWGDLYTQRLRRTLLKFDLTPDEFLMMGDNSPASYDGRMWDGSRIQHMPWEPEAEAHAHPHAVNRKALVGKAFVIYWPHGVPFLNDGQGYSVMKHNLADGIPPSENYSSMSVPFHPQWGRIMRRIH